MSGCKQKRLNLGKQLFFFINNYARYNDVCRENHVLENRKIEFEGSSSFLFFAQSKDID